MRWGEQEVDRLVCSFENFSTTISLVHQRCAILFCVPIFNAIRKEIFDQAHQNFGHLAGHNARVKIPRSSASKINFKLTCDAAYSRIDEAPRLSHGRVNYFNDLLCLGGQPCAWQEWINKARTFALQ